MSLVSISESGRSAHRTKAMLSRMSLELWREQHPNGHEQTMLDFKARGSAARKVPLFAEDREGN
jgi:hypothetical protein